MSIKFSPFTFKIRIHLVLNEGSVFYNISFRRRLMIFFLYILLYFLNLLERLKYKWWVKKEWVRNFFCYLQTAELCKHMINKRYLFLQLLTFLFSRSRIYLLLTFPGRMSKVPGQKVNIVSNFVRIVQLPSNIIGLITTYPYRGKMTFTLLFNI